MNGNPCDIRAPYFRHFERAAKVAMIERAYREHAVARTMTFPGRSSAGRAAAALCAACTPFAAAVPNSMAGEMCVVCTDPQAVYICQTDLGTSKLANAGAKMLCVSHLAKHFGHARCKVRRTVPGRQCPGQVVEVAPEHLLAKPTVSPRTASPPTTAGPSERQTLTAGDQPPTSAQHPMPPTTAPAPAEAPGPFGRTEKTGPTGTHQPAARADAAAEGPPRTVEELAKQAAKSSQESLEKAGEAVGGAAKKTWTCLTSLLTDC